MQIVKRTIQTLRADLNDILPRLFFEKEIRKAVSELQEKYAFSDSSKFRLLKSAKKLGMKWNVRASGNLYSFEQAEFSPLDILSAWTRQKGHYISHFSAMYYHSLIEQRPVEHFITFEVKGKSGYHSPDINEFRIKQAFLKSPRTTQRFFTYGGSRFFVLEKTDLGEPGVEEKTMRMQDASVKIRLTSQERTFIDALISPQYSGGIGTVVSAFGKIKLDINKLAVIYQKLNPYYPYWQSIGLFLEAKQSLSDARIWAEKFAGKDRIEFYIEHNARSTWDFSSEWKVYFPKGLF